MGKKGELGRSSRRFAMQNTLSGRGRSAPRDPEKVEGTVPREKKNPGKNYEYWRPIIND